MKLVVLILLLGLVCAVHEAPAELDPTQITGDWRCILRAADNKEKIEEGGPLRVYIRRLECTDNCSSLAIKFFGKFQGACSLHNIVAERNGEVYRTGYMGASFFKLIPLSDKTLAFYTENSDGVTTTKVTHLLAKGDGVTQEEIQQYEELNKEWGIPTENTEDLTETDDCHQLYLTASSGSE